MDVASLMMYNMNAPQRIVTKSLYRTDQWEYSIQGTCFFLIFQVTIVGPSTLRLGGCHDDVSPNEKSRMFHPFDNAFLRRWVPWVMGPRTLCPKLICPYTDKKENKLSSYIRKFRVEQLQSRILGRAS